MVAGVSAVVLLISLWLPWYGVSFNGAGVFRGSVSTSGNAWEWYGGRDIYLLLLALLVLAWVGARALDLIPPTLGFDPALVALVAGGLGVLFVFIGILHVPNHGTGGFAKAAGLDFTRKWGLFVGFLATCGITFGAWTAYNERRRGLVPGAPSAGGAPIPPAVPPASDPGAGPATPPTAAATSPAPSSSPATPAPSVVATPSAPPSAQPPQQNPPADWYPDPHGQARLRWWDGNQWTDQTAN
jgi:hypothetical protein